MVVNVVGVNLGVKWIWICVFVCFIYGRGCGCCSVFVCVGVFGIVGVVYCGM